MVLRYEPASGLGNQPCYLPPADRRTIEVDHPDTPPSSGLRSPSRQCAAWIAALHELATKLHAGRLPTATLPLARSPSSGAVQPCAPLVRTPAGGGPGRLVRRRVSPGGLKVVVWMPNMQRFCRIAYERAQ